MGWSLGRTPPSMSRHSTGPTWPRQQRVRSCRLEKEEEPWAGDTDFPLAVAGEGRVTWVEYVALGGALLPLSEGSRYDGVRDLSPVTTWWQERQKTTFLNRPVVKEGRETSSDGQLRSPECPPVSTAVPNSSRYSVSEAWRRHMEPIQPPAFTNTHCRSSSGRMWPGYLGRLTRDRCRSPVQGNRRSQTSLHNNPIKRS